jgi:ClpP class serine protease
VPLLAFVEDSAVSGGYYIACAADEIIADPSSLVGSVGVISRGFGYVKAIKKQGVERRVHSAGESKSGLDPYMKMRKHDLANQKRLLAEIHNNFIDAVKQGRGDRLKPEAAARLHHSTTSGSGCYSFLGGPGKRKLRRMQEDGAGLFDGSVYSGEVGLELGLVDGVGEMRAELQKRFGRFVEIERMEEDRVDYSKLLRWLL